MNVIELELDTDQFGTFSGEQPRTLSQYEAAVAKARLGAAQSGISLAIASEGAIGSDHQIPLLNSDVELVVFIDLESRLVISEYFRSFDITAVSREIVPGDDLNELLLAADFPHHGLIVRTEIEGKTASIKGITDKNVLVEAIKKLSHDGDQRKVIVESDLRAHFSPSRRKNISKAAELLSARVASLCPECQTPGWGRISYERGVACAECGLKNSDAVRCEILGCLRCEFTAPGKTISTSLDPAHCMECNP